MHTGFKRTNFLVAFSIKNQIIRYRYHPPPSVPRPVANYVTSTVETVLALHRERRAGDVLAFLTGQEEVEKVVAQLKEHAGHSSKGMQLLPLPLYGGLPFAEQVSQTVSLPLPNPPPSPHRLDGCL